SFFFQAEDGIRARNVTGVQTCALPIFKSRFQSDLAKCRSLLKRILKVQGPRTIQNTLEPFDELSRRLEELLSQPKFLFDVHPDAAMRQTGDEAYQEADRFATELSLNREVY